MPNGSLYYGKSGFLYKKSGGGGVGRVQFMGSMNGVPRPIENVYVSGSGVGANSVANRRAKLRNASIPNNAVPCYNFVLNFGAKTKYDAK